MPRSRRSAPASTRTGLGSGHSRIPERAPFTGIVGLAHATFEAPFVPCVEVVWRLAAEHWGKGYATEAALASVRFGFEALDLEGDPRLDRANNRASRRVMEKLGMTRDAAKTSITRASPRAPLQRHVLYRLSRSAFRAGRPAAV